ncbi:MAG TPA: hypothetical protein EYQ86_07165 [Bacteroidetes bacterium]|nr:hypothetical protein [Bacteroidota bacterium]
MPNIDDVKDLGSFVEIEAIDYNGNSMIGKNTPSGTIENNELGMIVGETKTTSVENKISHTYHQLGNSVSVPVIKNIFEDIIFDRS